MTPQSFNFRKINRRRKTTSRNNKDDGKFRLIDDGGKVKSAPYMILFCLWCWIWCSIKKVKHPGAYSKCVRIRGSGIDFPKHE